MQHLYKGKFVFESSDKVSAIVEKKLEQSNKQTNKQASKQTNKTKKTKTTHNNGDRFWLADTKAK